MPMLRAVPFTLLMAASRLAAFKSGIFCLAMSLTCFSVTLPTFSLLGAPEPLAIPAARFSSTEAGGVLVMKVKERSLYTVITTGMIRPAISLFWVRALNCLQNSMMLICAWPNAGPTGGAGVALPASICNFTCACIFFGAMLLVNPVLQKPWLRETGLDFRPSPNLPKMPKLPKIAEISLFTQAVSHNSCSIWILWQLPILAIAFLRHFLHLPKLELYRRCPSKDRDHHFQRLALFIHFVH